MIVLRDANLERAVNGGALGGFLQIVGRCAWVLKGFIMERPFIRNSSMLLKERRSPWGNRSNSQMISVQWLSLNKSILWLTNWRMHWIKGPYLKRNTSPKEWKTGRSISFRRRFFPIVDHSMKNHEKKKRSDPVLPVMPFWYGGRSNRPGKWKWIWTQFQRLDMDSEKASRLHHG